MRILVNHITLISLFILLSVQGHAGVTDTIQTNVPPLKTVYARDFSIGCLLSYRHVGFRTDPVVPGQSSVVDTNGGYLIKFHMNCMSPGNNMKAENTIDITASAAAYAAATTQAQRDSIDVHPTVRFIPDMIAQLNWAQRQGFTFRGHTLVWHNQVPAAFFRSGYLTTGTRLTKAVMTVRMENYIKELIRLLHVSWPGLLSAMDVVNEAVNDDGTFRTASNEWYTTFGDTTYVMKAFELTRAAAVQYSENQIKLYYNDYNTYLSNKANGIVRLCAPIYQAGLLDGIGMQEHDNNSTPTADAWIASYNKFDPICSEMSVTEFDVSTGSANPSAAVLAIQANQYGQLFKCYVERSKRSGRGKIINVSKDGLNDTYTFATNQSSSLWNGQDQCKPAFYASVGVGINYNALDSLVHYSDTLQQSSYTPASWARFAGALSAGRTARDRNYSPSVSADTALGLAKDSLRAGISGLVRVSNGAANNDVNPTEFSLGQNYPNPFNPTTHIKYSVPEKSHVSLKVYDILGGEVGTLFEGVQQAGNHVALFDATELASGVYLYRLKANNFVETKKLILLK
jgi:GH35 family endo-1,4-beta-xylanase